VIGYSKQFQEATQQIDWSDFDYEEIFNTLQPTQVKWVMCKGLQTLAVTKTEENKMKLALRDEDGDLAWFLKEEILYLLNN